MRALPRRSLSLLPALAVLPARAATHPLAAWFARVDEALLQSGDWRRPAMLFLAMHDAANAVMPRYATHRAVPTHDVPPTQANALLAAAAAGAAVLPGSEALLAAARDAAPPAQAAAAEALGTTIGRAMLVAFTGEGAIRNEVLPGAPGIGRWRAAPGAPAEVRLFRARPFLAHGDPGLGTPPAPDSAAFLAAAEEVRAWGGQQSERRSAEQTLLAFYWAARRVPLSWMRMLGAAQLARADAADLHTPLRIFAQVAAAQADALVLWVAAKLDYAYWRPVTALREGGPGLAAEPEWLPPVTTPHHPEFPSGHAADCAVGAALWERLFGTGPVTFLGLGFDDMRVREAPRAWALAEECAESRLWAGAHYRFSNDAGLALGRRVAELALAALPPRG